MARVIVRVVGLQDVINAIDPAVVAIPARNFLSSSAKAVEALAVEKAPNDRGGLRRSIAHTVDESYFPKHATVGTNLVYGRAIEYGLLPGKMPPVTPLEDWARRKGLGPGLGFVIARNIMKHGTKPQPFLEPALNEAGPAIKRYVTVFGKAIEAEAAKRGRG
jgi:phage gpG-like protein